MFNPEMKIVMIYIADIITTSVPTCDEDFNMCKEEL